MEREVQRRLALMATEARRARILKEPTLAATIAASADELMEMGVVQLRDYSPAQRRRMARTGKALPDGSYPIENCSDAANAIHAIGRAGSGKRGQVEKHIRTRVRSLGCKGSGFDNWK